MHLSIAFIPLSIFQIQEEIHHLDFQLFYELDKEIVLRYDEINNTCRKKQEKLDQFRRQ